MANVMQWLRGTDYSPPGDDLREELDQAHATVELYAEAAADAERQLAADDRGWLKLADGGAGGDFTREDLRDITARCRIAQWNALIGRGLELRTAYVHGSGVQISAPATGPTTEEPARQDVNAVVQAFLDDDGNQRVLTSPQAREEAERALGTDGNLLLACFTNPLTGRVQVRDVPWDQVADIVRGEDGDPQFYKRAWVDTPAPGATAGVQRTAWYPDLRHNPARRPTLLAGHPVVWDAPVLHVLVNRATRRAKYGVPDAFRAVAWAGAYKEFLEDWAKLVRSLSKIAWRTSTKGATAQAKARQELARATGAGAPTGQAAVTGPDQVLEAIPKTGATIDSESGRPLAAMVAAAMGVPVTMLLGDPGTTGARATAETLDRPTELMASMRRDLWSAVYRALLGYVIDQAVLAPLGPLQGTVIVDADGRERVELAGDTEATVEVTWPDLTETPVDVLMAALSTADAMSARPPSLWLVQQVLRVLGEPNVDEVVADVTDEQGQYVPQGSTTDPAPLGGGGEGDPVG